MEQLEIKSNKISKLAPYLLNDVILSGYKTKEDYIMQFSTIKSKRERETLINQLNYMYDTLIEIKPKVKIMNENKVQFNEIFTNIFGF